MNENEYVRKDIFFVIVQIGIGFLLTSSQSKQAKKKFPPAMLHRGDYIYCLPNARRVCAK